MVGLESPVTRAIFVIALPACFISWIALTCSSLSFPRQPFSLSPHSFPFLRATACPAATRSALISVSYSTTDARMRAWSRPAGDSNENPSFKLTRSTRRSRSSSKSWHSPFVILPKRSGESLFPILNARHSQSWFRRTVCCSRSELRKNNIFIYEIKRFDMKSSLPDNSGWILPLAFFSSEKSFYRGS